MKSLRDMPRAALSLLDPETAHKATIFALKSGILSLNPQQPPRGLSIKVAGLDFPSPLGLAAGFDKNAETIDAMLALGFGFVEAGTVTPRPQAGNPSPRIFRLSKDGAVINRLGFNNQGHEAVFKRMAKRRRGGANGGSGEGLRGIVGINIGANKDSADRIADYVAGVKMFHQAADYLTANISSPNTPGLRQLQNTGELSALMKRLRTTTAELSNPPPLFIKLAPDLADDDIRAIAEIALEHEIDGLIISNTTLARPNLRSANANEEGGLSGRPLFEKSTIVLAKMSYYSQGNIPLIGVGGISSGEDAWQKIRAGASLVQLYTGLVYHGTGLIRDIHDTLRRRLDQHGASSLHEVVGSGTQEWREKHDE